MKLADLVTKQGTAVSTGGDSNMRMQQSQGSFSQFSQARGKSTSFKAIMLQTLGPRGNRDTTDDSLSSIAKVNEIMSVGVPTSNTPALSLLDSLLKRDQMLTGFEVFKSGQELRNGLIDIEKVYDLVLQKETTADGTEFVKPLGIVSRQEKWKKVMKYMSQNPSFLLDAMPSAPRQKQTMSSNILSRLRQQVGKNP